MGTMNNHPDITNRKKYSELLTDESFQTLRGKMLLFSKDSKHYQNSGMVTAALLNYFDETVLAIQTNVGWLTFWHTPESLLEMMKCCEAVVGVSRLDSYILEFDND